jgi:hypothetical protein
LHGVAVRVCLNDRKKDRRRQRRVQEAVELAREQEVEQTDRSDELKQLIDEELAALPQRLRQVLVLCDLEGRSREEVARTLSLPLGTVSSRLARGRAVMRKRLVRRNMTIASGGVAMALAQYSHAAPAVSAMLVDATVRNAHIFLFGTAAAKAALGTKITTLAEGVLYTMLVNRWKAALCLIVLFASTLFGGSVGSMISPRMIGTASAATVFYDDFEDGSATDGSPAAWEIVPNFPLTTINVNGGNLRVGASTPDRSGVAGVPAESLGDTSIRAQLRGEGQGDQGFGVVIRGDVSQGIGYSFEVAADGSVWFGVTPAQRIGQSDLRPTEEDIILQLDAIGNRITAWA